MKNMQRKAAQKVQGKTRNGHNRGESKLCAALDDATRAMLFPFSVNKEHLKLECTARNKKQKLSNEDRFCASRLWEIQRFFL